MASLKERIQLCETGYLFYGLTPPKISTDEDKIAGIAARQMTRIKDIDVDALILYDLQDESARNNSPRPFPFIQTLQPDAYCSNYLQDLNIPKIIYKSVGKYSETEFAQWLQTADNDLSVFVGTPSQLAENNLSLRDAYRIKNENNKTMMLGGVTIPERHATKKDEHLRVFNKINNGCQFFVSQCVYSINNSLNFLSDYYYTAKEQEKKMVPIIFTLTPCGSLKSLDFLNWLGIDVPTWLSNELKHSTDILSKSVEACKQIASEIYSYCKDKQIPMGFNIESVAIRKEEIEASVELAKTVKKIMTQ